MPEPHHKPIVPESLWMRGHCHHHHYCHYSQCHHHHHHHPHQNSTYGGSTMAQALCSVLYLCFLQLPREASLILLYHRRIWIRKAKVNKFTKLEQMELGFQTSFLCYISVPSLCTI